MIGIKFLRLGAFPLDYKLIFSYPTWFHSVYTNQIFILYSKGS